MCLGRPAVCEGACNVQSEGRTKAWAHRSPYGWSPCGAGWAGGLVMTGRWGAATKSLVSHVKGVMKAPGNQLGGRWFRE